MKKILSLFLASAALTAGAQSVGVTPGQYDALKASGQLVPGVKYTINESPFAPQHYSGPSQKSLRSTCNCLIPLDTTFIVPMPKNDDFSSSLIPIPFTFNLYGVPYTSLYINNNGNISFATPYYDFTANPFPDPTYNMIAPFWGDVDTRDSLLGGQVYYKITPTSVIVKWEAVGYYPYYVDKLNTFQLIITDGTDPILPAGNNVAFCYGDMQWTTGDASSGMGGFGGVPATVGVNIGNGTNYFQVGRFDQPGGAFDGPYALSDGIDFLDNQEIYFNVADTLNIDPVIVNSTICDTIDVYTGDTLRSGTDPIVFPIMVSTPEIDQTVTATITCTTPAALTVNNTANTAVFKAYECSIDPTMLADGLNYVTVTATDNGSPVATSTSTVVIRVNMTTGLNETAKQEQSLSVYPNPASNYLTVKSPIGLQQVTVVDLLGHEVMNESVNASTHTLNLNGLNNGVYFIRVKNENGSVQAIKFLKK